jgi:probable HAF family extracellular repeat protein
MTRFHSLLLGTVFCLAAPAVASAVVYQMTDLGTLGGTNSWAYGIDQNGAVVGASEVVSDDPITHAFLYDGTMHDLSLAGLTLGGASSAAYAINATGYVTGYAETADGGLHAYLYDPAGSTADLGTLGGLDSYGYGINAAGHVVGESLLANGETHAFLHDGSQMHDLGTLGGTTSFANGINGDGVVVGGSYLAGDEIIRAFIYDSVNGIQDLGTLGGDAAGSSIAYAINSLGHVVGVSNVPGDVTMHAFLWDGTQMQDLGSLGGSYAEGLGLNDLDQVVGGSFLTGDMQWHPFLNDGAMHDLGTLGGTDGEAWGINSSGQIAGFTGVEGDFDDPAYYEHAFLANPVPAPTLTWAGLAGEEWGAEKWHDGTGLVSPAGGEPMIVESGAVEVVNGYTGTLAAESLLIDGGTVDITSTGTLEIATSVTVAGGSLVVDGSLLADEVVIEAEDIGSGTPAGVLSGEGTITAGSVTIGGILSPGSDGGPGGLSFLAFDGAAASAALAAGGGPAQVPEPGTLVLLALGSLALLGYALRRARRR